MDNPYLTEEYKRQLEILDRDIILPPRYKLEDFINYCNNYEVTLTKKQLDLATSILNSPTGTGITLLIKLLAGFDNEINYNFDRFGG